MTTATRGDVVSSFTIIKGAMIEETYAVFAAWDLNLTKRENLNRLRDENYIGAASTTWLRDVAKVVNRRFDPAGRDRALVVLAQRHAPLREWKPILLWHMTRDEFLLGDFLKHWLFPRFTDGVYRVRPEELDEYLRDLPQRGGITEHAWSIATQRRVAAGLIRAAVDFDLLKGAVNREFAGYHLPDSSFLYLLHALRDTGLTGQRVISSQEWRLFLASPDEVEREILRLHQFRRLRYEVAGSIVELELPRATALEFAEDMAA